MITGFWFFTFWEVLEWNNGSFGRILEWNIVEILILGKIFQSVTQVPDARLAERACMDGVLKALETAPLACLWHPPSPIIPPSMRARSDGGNFQTVIPIIRAILVILLVGFAQGHRCGRHRACGSHLVQIPAGV